MDLKSAKNGVQTSSLSTFVFSFTLFSLILSLNLFSFFLLLLPAFQEFQRTYKKYVQI